SRRVTAAVIRFPSLDVIEERSNKLRIPLSVVVRDIARLVEILNLKEKGFFDARSVLAGVWRCEPTGANASRSTTPTSRREPSRCRRKQRSYSVMRVPRSSSRPRR
ncbi:MAG TPA: hypothetical protein VFE45_05735, partial [Coriobacteriia bacterium]|nr:hypothetical protein [Coriobacteriia bacterium]